MMLPLIALVILTFLPSASPRTVALGNLAVTIGGKGVLSTAKHPLKEKTDDLWCEAKKDDEILTITWGRFIRVHDRHVIEAVLDENKRRARLHFGQASILDAGKYRCELRTEDGELVFGNMFANSRPVFHTNGSIPLSVSSSDPSLVLGPATTVDAGQDTVLHCPVIAYPQASVIWFKDDLPLESSANVKFQRNSVKISGVDDKDAGKYRCVATNQFAVVVDGMEQEFQVRMDQVLRISGSYTWLYPLIVILIILLILFIIIYSCTAYKRYKADQYNVEKREKTLRSSEEQRLEEENDD